MPINFDSALGIYTDALRIRSQRAELLASNLANVDTPNYKARDIDFKSALKLASEQSQGNQLDTTNSKHIATNNSASFSPAIKYRVNTQDSLDGNTVDEQTEQAAFMQNAVQYEASLQFLGGQFRSLITAIKGE